MRLETTKNKKQIKIIKLNNYSVHTNVAFLKVKNI